jgi:hypothetical protein
MEGTKLAGVIYIHRISDNRVGGIAARNFEMFRKLCGDGSLKNVIIVTNMWGDVTAESGKARERELANDDAFFKPVLRKGALMLPHFNTVESAHTIFRHILNNRPQALQIQQEIVDEHKDISQTAAGERLNRELQKLAKKYEEEIKRLEEDMRCMSSRQSSLCFDSI